MKLFNALAGAVAVASAVSGQITRYCDPLTTICYQSYTNAYGIAFRLALPDVSTAPFDLILQIVAPIDHKWVGFSFRGRMQYSPLALGWPNGASVLGSSRWATGYSVPQPYSGATFTPLKGTGANSTSWTLTVRCQGCSSWLATDGTTQTLNPTGSALFAWAQAFQPVLEPSNQNTLFNVHDSHGTWTHDLSAARSNQFDSWVASNLLGGSEPSSTTARSTTPMATTVSTTLATSTNSAGGGTPAIPTSCPGVSAPKYPGTVASGWRAVKIAGGLTTPRGIILDTAGRLLVVENGKGITAHTLGSNGCITSSKTLISQTNLNHGIVLTPDGRTLYASSMTTVWRWSYDPSSATVGSSTVVVNGMSNGGHATRTLVIPKNRPNLLVVSCGSNGNLDMPAQFMATQRAVVKVFDMTSPPNGGYSYTTGGWQAGYGLRNEVGLVFDADNNLWGVENSADDLTRVANGQTTDIHVDNPAEELHYLGDVSVTNTKWYGYPICFTVWDPSVIRDTTFQPGAQFMIQPNSSFNDATCAQRSTPARLGMQAHSAPLDAEFDPSNQNLYVSFHGSWNRPSPTGFKLVVIPFTRGSNGLEPVAGLNSRNGYNDVFWNTDSSRCSGTNCFRPVGIAIDSSGRIFMGSDAPGEGEIFLLGPVGGSSSSTFSTTTSRFSTNIGTTRVITSSSTTPISSPTTTRIMTTSSTTTSAAAGPQQTRYGQCGGLNWTGPKTCQSPYTCKYSNDWYSQCL